MYQQLGARDCITLRTWCVNFQSSVCSTIATSMFPINRNMCGAWLFGVIHFCRLVGPCIQHWASITTKLHEGMSMALKLFILISWSVSLPF